MKKENKAKNDKRTKAQSGKKMNKYVLWLLSVITIFLITKIAVNITYYYPDGVGYWIYLPTLWLDHDLDFSNNLAQTPQTMPLATTETGYIGNLWNVGTAVLLTPYFLIAKYFGFTSYLLFTNFGSTLYGILAVVLIYFSLTYLGVKKSNAFISSVVAFFGSPLFFYTYFLPQSAHPVSAFIVSLFLTYWLLTLAQYRKPSRWIFLGLIAGLMAMVRTQEIIFTVAIFVELILRWFKERNLIQCLKYISLFFVFAILAFTPQLLVWKIIYGSFVYQPQAFNLGLENFALFDVLFSPFHGILFWTPVIYFAFLGALLILKKNTLLSFALALPIILQIILISLITAWWGGYSFGIRYFANLAWPIGIGTGLILQTAEDKVKIIGIGARLIMLGLGFWTFLLAAQAKIGAIDIYAPLNFENFRNSVSTFPAKFGSALKAVFNPEINFAYPQIFLIFLVITFIFVFWLVHKNLSKGKFVSISCLILLLLAGWNYNVLVAYFHTRLPLNIEKETIPVSDLEKLFLSYDLKCRIDYYRLNKNEPMAEKTRQRLENIIAESELVKNTVSTLKEQIDKENP